MKSEFVLSTFDDEEWKRKLEALSVIECAFDDDRNTIPETFYFFTDELKFPLGRKIKVTFELVEE